MSKKHSRNEAQLACPVDGFQALVRGKYRLRILWELQHGPLRYGALKTALAASMGNKAIAARVLSRDLKDLAERSMIQRKDFGTRPPHIEYSLSKVGKTFIPVLRTIHHWGSEHLVKRSTLNAPGKRISSE